MLYDQQNFPGNQHPFEDRWSLVPHFSKTPSGGAITAPDHRARQLYKNIYMLFLFPVKMVGLVQASIHNVSYISLQ